MAQSNWEADKMLDVYIYDYLLKRNLQSTAKAFMSEAKVAADPVAIDAPGGFLFEWWSVFWDIFIARTNEKHSEVAAAYIETQQAKAREHQQFQMQQLQLMQRQAQLQRTNSNHSLSGPINSINSDGMLGPSPASVLAAKMYEERIKHPHSMDSEASPQLLDASRMALLKSATNHPGQLVQGNPGNVSAALQQIQARNQQTTDIKTEGNLGITQRSLPMDPSSLYGQSIIQSKSGLGGAGLNQGVSGLPLKGWPLTGIDQLRPNLGAQVQKPILSPQNQFNLLNPQLQQQFLAQAHAQGNFPSSNYGDMDPRRFRALPRGGLNGKDGQPTGTDVSIGSPIQSSSPKMRPDQAEYVMKLKVAQMQQSAVQQPQEQLQQQLQQISRKRKQASSSGAANSSGTGNTVGPSPNSPPSTPSTHTTGDGVAMTGNLQHANGMAKSLMLYGADGTGGIASSSNQMDDLEHFGDVASLDDNVDSFLHDDGDARDIFAALKRSPAKPNPEPSKGFTFSEFGCIRTSNGKVVCCHFSSDGKLLASAGHDKKAVLWNMDTLQQTESTPDEHTSIISDVRFRPNSTQLATASFDRTVRLWNAADASYCLHTYTGHGGQVTSLDFHPKKTDLFCSCDSNGEIRFWSVSQYSCSRVSKGGTAQVRFQPRVGQFLAAASDNGVAIFDVEADRKTLSLKDHTKVVRTVCWDANGDYLASVGDDSVKVWSLGTGECIHELRSSNGNNFHSCVFHPSYPSLLVIGGYQSLELWNMVENQTMTVHAHEGLIAGLAQSPVTGMVASASHDKSVKLWK